MQEVATLHGHTMKILTKGHPSLYPIGCCLLVYKRARQNCLPLFHRLKKYNHKGFPNQISPGRSFLTYYSTCNVRVIVKQTLSCNNKYITQYIYNAVLLDRCSFAGVTMSVSIENYHKTVRMCCVMMTQ